jgi:hypothetical protein
VGVAVVAVEGKLVLRENAFLFPYLEEILRIKSSGENNGKIKII